MTGKDYLAQIFTGINSLLDHWMEAIFGPWVSQTVFSTVSWADVGATICLAVFVLLLNGLAAAYLRHKTRQAAAPESKELHQHVCGAVRKPLYLLIWIYGIYMV